MWRLKYIHEVKDWIVPFHEPVGEWNRQFIFHRVNIFQHSHKLKTVNICFILLLHRFHNIIHNLCYLSMGFTTKKYNLFQRVWSSFMMNRRVRVRVSMRCVETFDSFCFQNVLSNGDGDSKNNKGQSTNQLSRIYVEVI